VPIAARLKDSWRLPANWQLKWYPFPGGRALEGTFEMSSDASRIAMNVSRGCIVATLQTDLDTEVLAELRSQVLRLLQESRARGVIVDCAAVEVMDASDFEGLLGFISMAALMGARVVLAGIRPGVASALADLGVNLSNLRGALTLDDAFTLLQPGMGRAGVASRVRPDTRR